jgi:hypothetical protein
MQISPNLLAVVDFFNYYLFSGKRDLADTATILDSLMIVGRFLLAILTITLMRNEACQGSGCAEHHFLISRI